MQPPRYTGPSMPAGYPGASGPPQNIVPQQQGSFYLQPSPPPLKLHQYSGREIAFIAGINALLFPAMGIDSSIGAILMLLVLVTVGYALVVDGAGVGTLRGAMRWASMSAGAKVWAVIGWLCLYPFFWWYYCGRITYEWYQARKAASQQRVFTVARMEADLGFQPAVEGACASCGKPLTVGAAFCAYCGHGTQVKAKVCPNCATLAPADGQFCPACRTPLD
ncbi:MAG TPA: zinc ribbon domain-containing protein [Ktedonobacterales bacterium]